MEEMIEATGVDPTLTAGSTYLTVEGLAELLHTSPNTVHYWIKVGRAPSSFKVGRRRLFARADVDAWVEEHRESGVA
ncbi:helix-turn-helix domain-containing protein [Nocardioides okcheonensis]|uniref:helix-turn-helix domain-containing protein n=1 Tax=Nocardioides okcheonensis TaxID=2894081 RepID=UPI001E54E383|nr:helix-turn-helix domain-containing protein [Nocardioides okcheonensis]UFN44521.1 helix-turn-helix domain-containing protein [Nocardioides okcheonensis]